jgi:hypothetical protein
MTIPLLAPALLALAPAQGNADAAAAKSWSQPYANALGNSFVDVAPLRSAPGDTQPLDVGKLIGEPVSWDGVVFVLCNSGSLQVRAFDAATRRLIRHNPVRGDDWNSLVVWNWRAGVVGDSGVAFFDLLRETKTWTPGPRLDVAKLETPRLHGGLALCAETNKVTVFSIDKAVARVSFDTPRGPNALRPLSAFAPAARATLVASGGKWALRVTEFDRLDSPKPTVQGQSDVDLGEGPADMSGAMVVRLEPVGASGAWLVARADKSQLVVEGAQLKVLDAPFVGPVAAVAGSAYGFDAKGAFVRMEASGSTAVVGAASDAPRGPITIARDVAYTGGRAIDLASGKELWKAAKFEPSARAIPIADQRVLIITGKGSLVFLGPRPASKPASGASGAAIARPGSGPGIVRKDGTLLAGNPVRGENTWRIENDEGGLVAEVNAAEVALVDDGSSVELIGAQSAVHRAWRNAIDAEHAVRLADNAAQFLRSRLVDDAKRLLAEAKSCGLDKTKIAELEATIAKTKPNDSSSKEQSRRAPLAKEVEGRKLTRAALAEGATWCRDNEMLLAASMLHIDGEKLAPDAGPADAALKELMPESFPWREAPDAVARWKQWAPKLITTGGAFVEKSEPIWKSLRGWPWDQGVVVLQTRHVLLCSRDETPEVVGGCLDAAEQAMELLHTLVPPEEGAPKNPLIVRLYPNKEEYMKQGAPDFTLGYYSPGDKISRFYVPDSERKDLLGRGLYSTVAHELTHHYLDAAWLGPATERKPQTSAMPGYWIVEGFATFVQDDVIAKMRARDGERPRDPACAYVAQGARGNSALLPFRRLLELTQGQFQGLSKEPIFDLTPLAGDSGMVLRPAEVNVFYEQSAALVWFLNYKAGPERRAKLAEYVRAQYIGALGPEGWKAIGYDTPEALDQAFTKFLQSTN